MPEHNKTANLMVKLGLADSMLRRIDHRHENQALFQAKDTHSLLKLDSQTALQLQTPWRSRDYDYPHESVLAPPQDI